MIVLSTLLALTLARPDGVVEVPFRRAENAIVVDAIVNGRSVSLVFDTGFSGTVVLSDSLDIGKASGSIRMRDFVGEFEAKTVKIKSLQLGSKPIDIAGKEVIQQPLGHISSGYGVHCDGLMGLAVIKDYVTEINFEKNKFIFHPKTTDLSARTPDNKRTFLAKMLMTGESSIEMTTLASTGKKMTLALDTGNAFYATTHKDVLERVGLWESGKTAKFQRMSGVASGATASWSFRMKDVTIFGVPVKESYWDVIDAPSGSAEGDGTVGYGFLQNFNITFDYDRRRVWFENFTGKVAEAAPGDIGISAAYDEQAKRVRIFRVAPDSPAEKAGIKEDDFLLSVGGVDTGTKRFDDLRQMLEGAVDSKVAIVTSHGGILNRQEIVRKQLVNE